MADRLLSFVHDWEWILLLLVGILEVAILILVFRERKERSNLIKEMENTRIEVGRLGRESYLSMIKDALQNSTHYVYFISHTLTSTMTDEQKETVYRLYKRGTDHRCITGKDPTKIRYMVEQRRKGVQVRVNDLTVVSTFRYQVSDDRFAVLGFSEQETVQSTRGILITNPQFCRMMKQDFLRTWENSLPLEDYLKSVLSTIAKNEVDSPVEWLAKEWDLNEEEKKLLLKQQHS